MEKREQNFEIDELLVSYITGNASSDEQKAVKEWLAESAVNRKYFDELKEIYKVAKIADRRVDIKMELAWDRIRLRHYRNLAHRNALEEKIKRRNFIRDLVKYAAIIIVAVSFGITGYRYVSGKLEIKEKEIWNTVEAPYGSRVRVILPDGSKVWLNAGSNLRYSSLFSQSNRTVFLNGEAFFSVVSDKGKQFIVKTSSLDIKVYGTEFNVRAYDDDEIIQTTLVKGSIELEGLFISRSGKKSIKLEPKQTATYYKKDRSKDWREKEGIKQSKELSENVIIVSPKLEIELNVNPAIYTSWKDPMWIIEKEPLWSLAEKFERRFNIKFIFENEGLAEYKFTGTLKDETLEQVLNLMKLSAPIEYKVKNNQVFLSENKYFKRMYDEMLIRKKNQ